MTVLLPEVQQHSVLRIMRDYFNQINVNIDLHENGDVSLDELNSLCLMVDRIYSTKIIAAVLE